MKRMLEIDYPSGFIWYHLYQEMAAQVGDVILTWSHFHDMGENPIG